MNRHQADLVCGCLVLTNTGRKRQTTDSYSHNKLIRGWYHGGRQLSCDNSFHSPTVIPPSELDKPSIIKRYHHRRTCSHTSPRRSPTMVMLHDTRFVECRWWNDGWSVKTVVTWRSSASTIPTLVSTCLVLTKTDRQFFRLQADLVCTCLLGVDRKRQARTETDS